MEYTNFTLQDYVKRDDNCLSPPVANLINLGSDVSRVNEVLFNNQSAITGTNRVIYCVSN